MSTDLDIRHDLEEFVSSAAPISQILPLLREFHARRLSQAAVLSILQDLRDSADSEEAEDRMLEIMDLVAGFCRSEDVVWESRTKD